jgi:hypothetical protein
MAGMNERTCRPAFGRGVGVAAISAIGLPGSVLLLTSLLGFWPSVAFYLIATAILYAAWLAPDRPARVITLTFSGVAGGMLLALAGSGSPVAVPGTVLGCALIISVSRSLLQYRGRPLRVALLELTLTGGGLFVAAILAGPSLLAMAAALWSYLLVQSFFLLAPGVAFARRTQAKGDPFDLACTRLERLFEE